MALDQPRIQKDTLSNSSFDLDDLKLAFGAWARPTTVGSSAGMPTGANDSCHAAAHLFGAVLSEELSHQAAEPNHDGVGPAIVHGT